MDLNNLLGVEEEPEKIWLITYSDMVTLLLALFILLAAISKVDEEKFEDITEALHKAVSHTKFTKPIEEIQKKINAAIMAKRLTQQVVVDHDPRGLDIEFRSQVLFDIGDDQLLGKGQGMLDAISAPLVQAAQAGYTIGVEGHTDNVPINSSRFRSNWELSTSRATMVVRHLIDEGVPKTHLVASGFADIQPKVPNDTPEHRAMNRRVVIKIIR